MNRFVLGIVLIALLSACEQRQQTGLANLDLPSGVGVANQKFPSSHHVVLRQDGLVHYDGQTVSVEAVAALVAARVVKGEQIYISAESGANVDYTSAVKVMDSLHAAGFRKFLLVAEDGKR